MLLIHTQKVTPRLDYAFKHIITRILGVKVSFTSVIEEFISHQGPKLSYGKQPMGNELFVQAHGLLTQQGFDDLDISVLNWEDTKCFFSVSTKSSIPFDIFSAAFYLLSRYEEYLPHRKDELGRFPASESLAYQEKFLQQPVIDIWAYKFKSLLEHHFPTIDFYKRNFNQHHLIEATLPFAYSQRGFLRNFIGSFKDVGRFRIKKLFQRFQVLLKLRKDPFNTFSWLVNISKQDRIKLSVFFLMGEGISFWEDFNTKRKRFSNLVKFVSDYTQVGLIFSYHSLDEYERLKKEKKEIEELTLRPLENSMNDKQVVNLPANYRDLLELEVLNDNSMVYEDILGFRAGTCTPFLFYDLDYEIKTPLIITPLAGKSTALWKRTDTRKENEISQLYDAIKQVNGVFSIVFTNIDFIASQTFWRSFISENLNNEDGAD